MGNYHPLTILSYALEYSYVSFEPWLYHFDSLALHVVATLLVYWFILLLSQRQVAAAIAALLFGLHPMHMESVAWIAGRKDELCAIGYLGACIAYTGYLRATSGRWKWYAITIPLFLFALLSKPTAVMLTPVLLLIYYFEGRRLNKNVIVEIAPFVVLSLVFGVLSLADQAAVGTVNTRAAHYGALERVALGAYALITYLWKAVVPAHLCCFYPYPEKVNGSLPLVFYIYPLLLILAVFGAWKYGRKNKVVVFGLSFFILNIALLLQFIPVGNAILADRYTYIPYIGLFFVAGWFVSEYSARFKSLWQSPLGIASLIYIVALGYASNARCAVWYYPLSLWTDELQKEPDNPIVYENLGSLYYDLWTNANDKDEKQMAFDSAFYLMKKSVALMPDSSDEYQALGMLYYKRHQKDSADWCFKTYVRLHPTPEDYANYGNFLVMMGDDDSAIVQYNVALAKNPDMYAPYLNLGAIALKRSKWDEAMKDFNAAISLNPRSGEAFYERSFCDTALVSKALALRDVEAAKSLGYSKVDSNFYNSLKRD